MISTLLITKTRSYKPSPEADYYFRVASKTFAVCIDIQNEMSDVSEFLAGSRSTGNGPTVVLGDAFQKLLLVDFRLVVLVNPAIDLAFKGTVTMLLLHLVVTLQIVVFVLVFDETLQVALMIQRIFLCDEIACLGDNVVEFVVPPPCRLFLRLLLLVNVGIASDINVSSLVA